MGDDATGALVLELLPARHGDALLLSWGLPGDRHRLLVDGGPAAAYPSVCQRLQQVATDGGLDLLVLTHIDADHIEGTLLLINDATLDITIGECWFNGPAQLGDDLGPAQGEMLAALVGARGIPLNAAFAGAAVCTAEEGALPTHCLPGGLRLTVLGPDRAALDRLKAVWFSTCLDEGLVFPSPDAALEALRSRMGNLLAKTFLDDEPPPDVDELMGVSTSRDSTPPNRSSIVLLAEYDGATALLAGDATPTTLTSGVRRLLDERGLERLEVDAFKLPHHGSARNLTPELLGLLPAESYLFSSDGGKFGHPDDVAVARCLAYGKRGATLVFNYRTPHTSRWEDDELLSPREHRVAYPAAGADGVQLCLTGHGVRG